MSNLLRDLRYALRALRNSPGFTLAAVVTLALGLGATTTIFSAVDAVLLETPPYPAPDELALVTPVFDRATQPPDTQEYWSYPMYETFRAATVGAGEFAAFTPTPRRVNLAGDDAAEPVLVEMVSQAYFGILGVTPRLGRFFAPDEDVTPNTHAVAVLSERLWRRTFGADPAVVGSTIRLDATPFTVVGVAPAGFRGLSDQADLWTPMMMAPTLTFSRRLTGQLSFWHMVIARIPTGTDPAPRLAAGARAIANGIPLGQVFGDGQLRLASVPLQAARTDRRLGRVLLILLGAVGLVLLIACANVASLQLARARRRRRELGLVADEEDLGVGRGRLTRQLFVESAVVALLGGAGGVLLSAWGLDLLNALRPRALATVGGPGGAQLTTAVVAFAFAATVGAALLFGLLPAWWASRADPLSLIRADTGGTRRVRTRGALVAVEVALAIVLLAGAGLLVRTVVALNRTPLGFDPAGVAVALVNPPARAYPDGTGQQLFRDATDRLAALPGVRRAAASYCLPVVGGCDHVRMTIAGTADPSAADHEVWLNMVDEAYLATLGIPVVAGRGILRSDGAGTPAVALVSEAAARRYWPGRNPVGQRIQLSVGWPENDGWAEVVGVVRDVRYTDNLRAAATPGVYLAMAQFSYRANYLVADVSGDAAAAIPTMRAVLHDLDPQLPLWDPASMAEHVRVATASERFSMVLLAAFGALALALAAVGIYGVIAYSVAGRTREIGLRMALGARPGGVVGLIFRQGFGIVGVGLAVGTLGALLTTRVLRAQLYDVSPSDPATLSIALGVLVVVAAAATWIPARRGARVPPMEALRHE